MSNLSFTQPIIDKSSITMWCACFQYQINKERVMSYYGLTVCYNNRNSRLRIYRRFSISDKNVIVDIDDPHNWQQHIVCMAFSELVFGFWENIICSLTYIPLQTLLIGVYATQKEMVIENGAIPIVTEFTLLGR